MAVLQDVVSWAVGIAALAALLLTFRRRPQRRTAVVIGGSLGSRLGSRHWPVAWIRRILAFVLVLAALKLLDLHG